MATSTLPTLPSGASFTAYPLDNPHNWDAIQDKFDSGHIGSRERRPYPRRRWRLEAPVLPETDIHTMMGWIRDDLKGGANDFTMVNPTADLWDPGKVPTLGQSAGGALGGATYYVVYTWSDSSTGETRVSGESSYTTAANKYLTVDVPTFPQNVTQANIYIGTASGTLYYSGKITSSDTTWTQDDSSTVVNGDSAAAQKILLVAATAGLQVGGVVRVDDVGHAREEYCVIASIQAGTSLTMEDDLTYTHLLLDADPVVTVVGNANASATPSDNTFAETVTVILDEEGPTPNPVRAFNKWRLELHVIEVFP